jgi:DNA-binding response OmpR family regulator
LAAVKGRVLIADGERFVRVLARVALESEGWSVVEAASGDEAAQLAAANAPHVAVLDAGIDGFDVAARLSPETAVVFVSARQTEKARADEQGAPFLLKPYNPAALVAVVQQAAG